MLDKAPLLFMTAAEAKWFEGGCEKTHYNAAAAAAVAINFIAKNSEDSLHLS